MRAAEPKQVAAPSLTRTRAPSKLHYGQTKPPAWCGTSGQNTTQHTHRDCHTKSCGAAYYGGRKRRTPTRLGEGAMAKGAATCNLQRTHTYTAGLEHTGYAGNGTPGRAEGCMQGVAIHARPCSPASAGERRGITVQTSVAGWRPKHSLTNHSPPACASWLAARRAHGGGCRTRTRGQLLLRSARAQHSLWRLGAVHVLVEREVPASGLAVLTGVDTLAHHQC